MKCQSLELFDSARNRKVPAMLYLPEMKNGKLVVFSPGYQGQEALTKERKAWQYKEYQYLVKYFINEGYTLVSIQHDIPGDVDGLETLNPNAIQNEERRHLWARGEQNIFFVMNEIKKIGIGFNENKITLVGHSNGGDISKFFANNNSELVESVICLDGRRCCLNKMANFKVLAFEANDTTTDDGVFPGNGNPGPEERVNLEWVIVKPKNATHAGYCDDEINGDKQLHAKVLNAIDWFVKGFIDA